MGEQSAIEWTDHTWNPWRGCAKVSAGCANCYMYRDQKRYGNDPSVVVRASDATFNLPLRLKAGRVFTCSWSDWFIEDADPWRPEAWDIIRKTPHLTYQILTKRPERIASCLPHDWGNGWPNVWLVVSCEDQKAADERILKLLQFWAAVRGVSAGPLIGPIDLLHLFDGSRNEDGSPLNGVTRSAFRYGIDWLSIECESGPNPRGWDAYEANARILIEQCKSAGVPVFHKQMPVNGRVSHNPDEWPEWARVRQLPGKAV